MCGLNNNLRSGMSCVQKHRSQQQKWKEKVWGGNEQGCEQGDKGERGERRCGRSLQEAGCEHGGMTSEEVNKKVQEV